jgi:hypothetical protein
LIHAFISGFYVKSVELVQVVYILHNGFFEHTDTISNMYLHILRDWTLWEAPIFKVREHDLYIGLIEGGFEGNYSFFLP